MERPSCRPHLNASTDCRWWYSDSLCKVRSGIQVSVGFLLARFLRSRRFCLRGRFHLCVLRTSHS
jgi:hypothetical protein